MKWHKSFCYECYTFCPIQVGVEDGMIVEVQGDTEFPRTQGRLCAKGKAAIMRFYDPNVVKKPLKRTNPQKGRHVDAQWVEITWEEALNLITDQLKRIREVNPKGLRIGTQAGPDPSRNAFVVAWGTAFGTERNSCAAYGPTAGGVFCGSAWHLMGWLYHGSYVEYADYQRCRYFLMIGTGQGHEAELGFNPDAKRMADARLRGMRLVVVDPRFSNAAAKADEWVPIRPGTDGALALAMLEVLLHEIKVCDSKFLKQFTNATYLLDPDGRYMRASGNGKPLIWDERLGRARPYDGGQWSDSVLTGEYVVEGVRCKPAFQVVADHVQQYTPEWAEAITTVPAATIRRLSRELVEAAEIGSAVEIDGELWPQRPVAIATRTGLDSSVGGGMASRAVFLILCLLGALSVPGGNARLTPAAARGVPPYLLPVNSDGIIWDPALDFVVKLEPSPQWPLQSYSLKEVFPFSVVSGAMHYVTGLDPSRFGLKTEQVIILECTNPMHSLACPDLVESVLQRAFVVVMEQYMTETAVMADVILPSTFNVERYGVVGVPSSGNYLGVEYSEPVIPPMYERRDLTAVLLDLAERVGFLQGSGGFNDQINKSMGLIGKNALDLARRHSWPEIAQKMVLSSLPSDKTWEQVRQAGWWVRNQTPDEKYLAYRLGRIPFYPEFFQRVGGKLQGKLEEIQFRERTGIDIDFSMYAALPSWKPSTIHKPDPEYDLYAITYKPAILSSSRSAFNPWLMEVADRLPHTSVWMHPKTAKGRNIADSDIVCIESRWGKTQGQVKLTEGIHPECVALPSILGHTVDHCVAHGRGAHMNTLLPLDLEHMEHVFCGLEGKVRVRVYPARPQRA